MASSARSVHPLPASTRDVASQVYPHDDPLIAIGGRFDLLVAGTGVEELQGIGSETAPPAVLALVTVFQAMEGLTDAEAAQATRTRIDWKYALHLPIDFSGIRHVSLVEFRERLASDPKCRGALDRLLTELTALELAWKHEPPPGSTTALLAIIRTVNRLPLVHKTLSLAIDALGEADPDWFVSMARSEWKHRYAHGAAPETPSTAAEREALALTIGSDGFYVLECVASSGSSDQRFGLLPEVELLRMVWRWQFDLGDGFVRWRLPQRARVPEEPPSPAILPN